VTRSEQIEKWLSRTWEKAKNCDALYIHRRAYTVPVWENSEKAGHWTWRITQPDSAPTDAIYESDLRSEQSATVAALTELARRLGIE
jgi:hypothetical protein